jgi:hypothetical protein
MGRTLILMLGFCCRDGLIRIVKIMVSGVFNPAVGFALDAAMANSYFANASGVLRQGSSNASEFSTGFALLFFGIGDFQVRCDLAPGGRVDIRTGSAGVYTVRNLVVLSSHLRCRSSHWAIKQFTNDDFR